MTALNESILEYVAARPEGAPITAKELLHLGHREAVDQALSRLARAGNLIRSARGLYVRPIESRFGRRPPSVEQFMAQMAKQLNVTIAPHGAAAANSLGLTTQVPMRSIYLTTGNPLQLKLGAQTIELKRAPNWQLSNLSGPAGQAVRALAWIGPAGAKEALNQLKRQLPESVLQEIAGSRAKFPEWLAKTVSTELLANG